MLAFLTTHESLVSTYKVGNLLGQQILVQVNVDNDKSVKGLGRVVDGAESVWTIDSGIAVSNNISFPVEGGLVVLQPNGKSETGSLARDNLAWGQSPGASLVCVRGCNVVGLDFGRVRVWIGVLDGRAGAVHRPCGYVDFLVFAGVERLEEGVHLRLSACLSGWAYGHAYIFPAVQVAEIANFSLDYGVKRVTASLAKYKLLDMSRLDLATVVDDGSGWINDDLRHVHGMAVELGVSQRDVDLGGLGSLANSSHFVRVGPHAVLVKLLEEGQRILVVHTPQPIRKS